MRLEDEKELYDILASEYGMVVPHINSKSLILPTLDQIVYKCQQEWNRC